MADRKLIRVIVRDHEYHCLDIMVTDNPRYLRHEFPEGSRSQMRVYQDADAAADKIRDWLRNAMTNDPRWKREHDQHQGQD